MAKINTLNYQTVAAWNGSQDLFVVEQTDGTKVATPEQVKQYVLGDMDEVPTQNSNNPVKSGGIFSTMAVPKYDAANRREYYEGGSAFSGNIDSTPTAGSNNAVASGGTKTYVDNAVSQLNDEIDAIPKMHIVHFEVTINNLTAWGSVYEQGFNVDISSLHLTNQPRFISMELLNPDIGGWLRGFTINNANTSIGAVFTRPMTVTSGNIRGNILIIE